MTITEHRHADNRVTITLHDGRRLVAKARPVAGGGYMVSGNGVCLLDKLPHPMATNGLGPADPTRYHVNTIREARRAMARLNG